MFRLGLCILLAVSECLSISAPGPLDWAINNVNDIYYYYLVKGDNYYKFDLGRRERDSGKVSDLFPGLPSGIQAATFWPGEDQYYFFKDGKFYRTTHFGGHVSGPFDGKSLGDIFTRPIDGATTLNGMTYFFQNSHVYEFAGETLHRDINAATYGLPTKIDAALTVFRKMFFFEREVVWTVYPYLSRFTVRSLPFRSAFRSTSLNI